MFMEPWFAAHLSVLPEICSSFESAAVTSLEIQTQGQTLMPFDRINQLKIVSCKKSAATHWSPATHDGGTEST